MSHVSINTTPVVPYVKWEQFFNTSDITLLFFLNEHPESRFYELLQFIEKDKRSNKRSMLARSLRDLQDRNLIERTVIQTRPIQAKYKLTDNGRKAVLLLNSLQKLVHR